MAICAIGDMRGGNFAADRYAPGVLVGANEMARKIFVGEHSGAAVGIAADSSGILSAARFGSEWIIGKAMDSALRTYAGIYIHRTRVGFGDL